MLFEVLGTMRVRTDGQSVEISGKLRQRLLAVLLFRANAGIPSDTLRDLLWGDHTDPAGPQRLQVLVHRLRGLLDDPERLSFGPGGYRLRVAPDEIDADQFCALLDRADAVAGHDPGQCVELVRQALGMWRGDPYHGVDMPDLDGEAQRLAERRLAGAELLYANELRLGRSAAVVADLSDLVDRNPLRERLHGLLMTALYQSGRQDDALAAYRRARAVAIDELGLEPGPELRALERTILAGEAIALGPETQTAVVPAQLPRNTTGFVGRDREVAMLDRLCGPAADAPVAIVAGTAGVGKTALALWWAHRARVNFPDGQLFLDLRGYGPDRPVSAAAGLAELLRALGVAPDALPGDVAARAALFRTLVSDRRMLVVLDNAGSADQVRPLLPGSAHCATVVTSRDTLPGLAARDGACRIDLGLMSAPEAVLLVRQVLGDRCDEDPDATAQFVDHCTGLPLALRIATERIRHSPRHRIRDLVTDLADEQAVLDLLDLGDDPDASVRAAFNSSYHRLDPPAARMFRALGMNPGAEVDLYGATALAGSATVRAAVRLLDALVRASLVVETAYHRYRLHDLLWRYAAELAETTEPAADRTAALARLLDYYLHVACLADNHLDPLEQPPAVRGSVVAAPVLADYAAALEWFDTERPNLVRTALRAAEQGLGDYVADLSTALFAYLDLGKHHDDAQALNAAALAAAGDDPVAQGVALRQIGLLKTGTGDTADGLRDVAAALALHEKSGDPLALAASTGILGALHSFDGDPVAAARHLTRSVELYRAADRRELAYRPLTFLGHLMRRAGKFDDAAACLHEALDIADAADHPLGRTHAHRGLVALYRDAGRIDDAVRHAHAAEAAARMGRINFLHGLSLHRLGSLYRQLGDYDQSLRFHHDAQLVFAARRNGNLEAMACNGAGETYSAADQPAESMRCHQDALHRADPGSYQALRAEAGLARLRTT
ncbi:MAG: tetratricopeptide repeat protein [Mycobacteriaceae bacterium]|nr:tetratricopeptide repeat protein [Mycobacteriaceae bacterium]